MKMKYYSQQAVHENTLFNRCIPNDIGPSPRRLSLKPNRSVHFSNDIIFQEHVRQGDLEQIGRFIRAGKINLNTIYLSGMAALHEAVLSGNLESVKLLVKSGADIHQQDEDGWTPLHIACSDGFPDIARYLLSMGASVDVENKCGEKPADLIDSECPELVKLFEKVCD
ncbi:protein phosphatase 1 regulatory subunit 27-like [Conger conger]|uniref:protein phosphatase 1 regulatory subunit 27-like n=1 Tax=Conger conger TaxID=82655 RepID=UPI002A5A311E|nr:protein phosphatase 1 regulatory subunit 27-like [Conger conger]